MANNALITHKDDKKDLHSQNDLNDEDNQISWSKVEVNRLKTILTVAKECEESLILNAPEANENFTKYNEKLKNTIVIINIQLLWAENAHKKLEITNQNLAKQIDAANSTEKDKTIKKLNNDIINLSKEKMGTEEDFRVVLCQNERNCARIKTLESTIEALHDLLKVEREKNNNEGDGQFPEQSEIVEDIQNIQINLVNVNANPPNNQTNPPSVQTSSQNVQPNPPNIQENQQNTQDGQPNSQNVETHKDPHDTDNHRPHPPPSNSNNRDIDLRPNSPDYQCDRRQFCHFWNNGFCRYSVSDCKFQHEESPYCDSNQNCTTFRCQYYHETSFLFQAPPPPPPPL
jgi:hypothetical protein